jgi:hypothetical protein
MLGGDTVLVLILVFEFDAPPMMLEDGGCPAAMPLPFASMWLVNC